MADEDKGLSEKEAQNQINKLITSLRKSTAQTTKGQVDAFKSFEERLKDVGDKLTDEQTVRAKRAALLESSLGFDKVSAMQIAKTTEKLEMVRERLSDLKELAKETNQENDAVFKQETEALILQERQLEEQQKFGRNLNNFERTVGKTAGGLFKKIGDTIKENGSLTAGQIGGALKDDLKGDLDKVMNLFGPLAGILQQIPFLGTIFNLLKRSFASILLRMTMGIKNFITESKRRKKVDRTNLNEQKKTNKKLEQGSRDNKKAGASTTTGQPGQEPESQMEGDSGEGGFVFQKASLFLVTAAALGAPAGAALMTVASGMTAFGKSAFAMGKALVVGGAAFGIGLTGVFGAFALGQKMGAFEGMQEFGKVNMLKVLGSMLGLATLMGVLGMIMTSGVGALIMGVGALAVMGLIGVLVVVGKGLGNFAESIIPFETLNIPRIKQNIQQLGTITGDIREILSSTKGFSMSQIIGQHPLEDLAAAVNMYDQDMAVSIDNLTKLKDSLAGFEFPELPEGEKGFGGWMRGLIGEDFSGELKKLSKITLTSALGDNLQKLGDGLAAIGDGLAKITDTKVKHLEAIAEALEDMEDVTINIGSVTPNISQPISPAVNAMFGNQPQLTQINAPTNQSQVNNMSQKRFVASGSNMGQHSALSYAGQLN